MANVLVERSYLEDIADSIRAKLAVTDTYKPAEMSGAIDSISGGGITPTGTISINSNGTYNVTNYASADVAVPTASGTKQVSITQNGTTTEDVTNYASAQITVAVPGASLGTKSITANGTYNASSDSLDGYSSVTVNVSGGGGTDNLAELCNGTLTRLDDDNITSFLISLRSSTFNLGSIFLKNLETLSVSYCFANNKVQTVVLPSLKNVTSAAYYFSGASSLTKVDLGASFSIETYGVRNNTFSGASAMNVLILRKTSEIVPLQNISAFTNTPFASGGTGGTLYVPQSLISTYQAANNWSTILGYANNSIQKIEGSIYETAYADGTPIA